MKYSKEEKDKAFELEQKYREYLSAKYASYMTSANEFELNLLSKLVDIRYDEYPKRYSNIPIDDAFLFIEDILS